jgi:polysaccharide biosynthesis protein PelF
VQNYVKERNIPDIIFTGKVSDDKYIKLLYSMDIFLLTSISEGQPLSVLEAMAYGKPAIVTDVGSCSELILGRADKPGEAGIVVPVMNQKAVADAIIRLASDRDLRIKMGEIARLRVLKDYTIKRMKDSYIRLYEAVIHEISL